MRVTCRNPAPHPPPIAVLVDGTSHWFGGQPGRAGRALGGEQGFETPQRDAKGFDPDTNVTGQASIVGEPAGEGALISKSGIGAGVAPVATENLVHDPA